MRHCYQFFLVILTTLVLNITYGQGDLLAKTITLQKNIRGGTIKENLSFISEKYNIVFSYNASILNDQDKMSAPLASGSLREVLEAMFKNDELILISVPPNKIIIQSKGQKQKDGTLTGWIFDSMSGESVSGALVVEKHSGISVLTNEKGYYIMDLPQGEASLEVRYLGYKPSAVTITIQKNTMLDLPMTSDNLLDTIVIGDPKCGLQLIDGGHMVDVFKTREYKSIIGETDIINNTRILPGVQSGGEGQSGLYVRGGTPDQNLILLEGVAMYETSHIAGISSIFMDESIKEASFIKNGFPARYGGRLASVLDIHLKEGDRYKQNVSLSAGIAGAKIHFDGPIKSDKTTYSVTARTSWLNFYVNSLLKKFTRYDDINIAYTDIIGKVTRQLSQSSTLSFTVYTGNDRLQLTKENIFSEKDLTLNVYDKNALNWGNRLASLKWTYLLNDKISLKLQSGAIKYNNGSRATYQFTTTTQDSVSTDELDVITRSNITDYNIRVDADYYLNDRHVIRCGINSLYQNFNPTVKQSTVILQGNADNIIDKDSLIKAHQYQMYLEDNFKINTSFFLYGGLHYTVYNQGVKSYASLQPRLKAIWSPDNKNMLVAAYSRMSQNVHLLSNSGLGLPSDLWVPSTETIKPQQADQTSISYTFYFNPNMYINAGAFTRSMSNSLEYTSPIELFYFLIDDRNVVPIYNTSKDWERNLISGKAKSRGLELLVHKTAGKSKGWTSLTWSKTEKIFSSINRGLPFPANHDKTWDLNAGLIHKFSSSFSTALHFVYTTGNTFSLATEEYDSALGITLLKATDRNNYRLPAFHQLSLNASYSIKSKNTTTSIDLNVYNIYNRLNAYFIYIYENPAPPYNRYLRKVSILPFTPSLSVSLKF